MLDFGKGMKYPWGRPIRLWNILWALLPIFGWLALAGYQKRIVNSIVKGKTKELPEFGAFWENFVNGFWIFVKMLPIILLSMIVYAIPLVGKFIYYVFVIFFLPWLMINLYQKFTLASTFELDAAAKAVFGNFGEYIIAVIKSLLYTIIYAILSIILIGIPCSYFGKNIFLADFYAMKESKK